MPAAVGKLGLAADPAGRGIVLVDGLLSFVLCPDPPYLLLIARELLMKRPGDEREKTKQKRKDALQPPLSQVIHPGVEY